MARNLLRTCGTCTTVEKSDTKEAWKGAKRAAKEHRERTRVVFFVVRFIDKFASTGAGLWVSRLSASCARNIVREGRPDVCAGARERRRSISTEIRGGVQAALALRAPCDAVHCARCRSDSILPLPFSRWRVRSFPIECKTASCGTASASAGSERHDTSLVRNERKHMLMNQSRRSLATSLRRWYGRDVARARLHIALRSRDPGKLPKQPRKQAASELIIDRYENRFVFIGSGAERGTIADRVDIK